MGNQAPAGWYPDPSDSTRAQTRYWDGLRWTEHVPNPAAPIARPSPQQLTPPAPVAASTLPTPPPQVVAQAVHVPAMPAAKQHGVFGGKKGLEEENAQLRALLDSFGIAQCDALRSEIAQLDAQAPTHLAERSPAARCSALNALDLVGFEKTDTEHDRRALASALRDNSARDET